MLAPTLARFGVEYWADDYVHSGDRWERKIDDALGSAELGLLLVTPDYLASSFSWEVEVPALVSRGVPIVWALVRACLWDDVAVLREVQGLQDPSRDGALERADQASQNTELARICCKLREEHRPSWRWRLAFLPAIGRHRRLGSGRRPTRTPRPTS